jgi:hypothetical protein
VTITQPSTYKARTTWLVALLPLPPLSTLSPSRYVHLQATNDEIVTHRQLNQAIAHELDTDTDLARYRLICRSTNNAVDADKYSFWRARFRERFAFKEGRSNIELKKTYMERQKHLRRGTGLSFFRGHNRRESDAVMVLKDLIVGKSPCSE